MLILKINELKSKYNAVLDEFIVDRTKYSVSGEFQTFGLNPSKGIRTETVRKLRMSLGLLGTQFDRIKNSTRLLNDLKDCTIYKDGLYYEVTLPEQDITPEEYGDEAEYLEIDLNLIHVKEPPIIKTITANTTIHINSPKSCYADLEIRATIPIISYTIKINDTTIIVKNIKASETIYIGSGKVTTGGLSKMNDVEMWEFPLLMPGSNNITVNRSDVSLTIKYNERW